MHNKYILNNSAISKFVTRKWIEVNDLPGGSILPTKI